VKHFLRLLLLTHSQYLTRKKIIFPKGNVVWHVFVSLHLHRGVQEFLFSYSHYTHPLRWQLYERMRCNKLKSLKIKLNYAKCSRLWEIFESSNLRYKWIFHSREWFAIRRQLIEIWDIVTTCVSCEWIFFNEIFNFLILIRNCYFGENLIADYFQI
jgi:hypothetical protein